MGDLYGENKTKTGREIPQDSPEIELILTESSRRKIGEEEDQTNKWKSQLPTVKTPRENTSVNTEGGVKNRKELSKKSDTSTPKSDKLQMSTKSKHRSETKHPGGSNSRHFKENDDNREKRRKDDKDDRKTEKRWRNFQTGKTDRFVEVFEEEDDRREERQRLSPESRIPGVLWLGDSTIRNLTENSQLNAHAYRSNWDVRFHRGGSVHDTLRMWRDYRKKDSIQYAILFA